jgi:hypothetical protein
VRCGVGKHYRVTPISPRNPARPFPGVGGFHREPPDCQLRSGANTGSNYPRLNQGQPVVDRSVHDWLQAELKMSGMSHS